MPVRNPIAIQDGATTPVTHTFSPIGKPAGSEYEVFTNRANGVASFQEEVRIRVQQPTKKGQPYRVSAIMVLPTTKVVDGDTVLAFQNRADLALTLSPDSTTQSREDLRVLLADLITDAIMVGVVDQLESIYG